MNWRCIASVWVALTSLAGSVFAHESRPGYLQLRQTDAVTFNVLWKVPTKGDMRLGIYPRLPENCVDVTPPLTQLVEGAVVERRTVQCVGGLAGRRISIDGLDGTMTDVIVRFEPLKGVAQSARLSPSNPSMVIEAVPSRFLVAGTYTLLGVEHILLGVDHLLFVLCLLFVAGTGRRLFIIITGFTIAHSLTLAGSALGLVRVPVQPVEAIIALSVLFLAVEIAKNRQDSLTYRYPILVSSTFGLLHGFGFASVLGEIGLPQHEIVTALLCFNIGVEIGQVIFVGVVLAALILLRIAITVSLDAKTYPIPAWIRKPAIYTIGTVASYWFIERVAAFWT
jgi:hydrogenase/urease accessory protein HupE